jgi:hypothetical protein
MSDAHRQPETGGLSARMETALLALIVLVGAWFRLVDLGAPAFRADTILLWGLANRPVPLFDVLTKWFEVSGAAGQMPMPAFLMKALLEVLPVTPFTVRLPFALTGIAAIPVAYYAGRCLAHGRVGLLLAAFVALNPFHIHFSREAYFYAPLFLGYFIYLRAIAGMDRALAAGTAPPRREYLIFATALFFSGYSQMSGLLLCAVGFFYLLARWWPRRRVPALKTFARSFVILHAAVFAPFLFVAWGPREMVLQLFSAQTDYGRQVVAMTGENIFSGLSKALSGFSWGTTPWAIGLLAGSLALGTVALVRVHRGHRIMLAVFLMLQVVLFVLVRSALAAFYESRYLGGLFPFWLFLFALGWCYVIEHLIAPRLPAGRRAAAWLVVLLPLAGMAYPAALVPRLTGNPTPYHDIVRFADSIQAPGTPVLVDRWFEPWNELAAHPSSNAVFTFTVPNEPIDTFLGNNWRTTARQFLESNPDASYLEIAKTYHDQPSVGPWPWPREFFARHHAITNDAGLALRKLGLAVRGDYLAVNTNRLVVEFFYNTRDDLLARWQAEGRQTGVFYGDGWRYEKSGPMGIFRFQTQDFRAWRVMQDRATVEVVNLTDAPLPVILRVAALSPAGPKTVTSDDGRPFAFSGTQMQRWEIGPLVLNPGSTTITLTDRLYDRSGYPLLVSSIEARPAAHP